MSDWFVAIVLGIIEGITEFLPVSSTGHLLLAAHWLPPQTDLFNIVIQSGAVLAVIPLFWPRFQQFILRWRDKDTQDYITKVFAAFFLTSIGGLLLDKMDFKLEDEPTPIAIALIVGGVLFLLVERWLRGRDSRNDVTWTIAIMIGVGQLIAAVFPGASRSGTTILLALMLGLGRPAATEFSFLVGIPTMLAAGSWKIFKALRHTDNAPTENWQMVFIGAFVSAIVSFVAVKWLLRYVQSHSFSGFGWYRIVLGMIVLLFFA